MKNLLHSDIEMTVPLKQRGLLRHIHDLNRWNPKNFYPFYIADHRVGYVKHYLGEALKQWPNYFSITDDAVRFSAEVDRINDRSQVLDEVVHRLVDQGMIKYYLAETYPVTGANRDQVLAKLDRGAAIYFGIKNFSQHLNGYANSSQGLKLWAARRAPDRIRFPNMLDNLVAGGLPENLSLYNNLIKECEEEANIPVDLVKTAKAVGVVSYCRETEIGLKPDTLYCYDLELPETFVPQNTDGEVSEFQLLPVEEIIELIRNSNEFKPNSNLVNLDFLIRHGHISPDEPYYLELVRGLHGVT